MEKALPGELYEPVGKPTKGYAAWCLDEKLAAELWDWTEKELESFLAYLERGKQGNGSGQTWFSEPLSVRP